MDVRLDRPRIEPAPAETYTELMGPNAPAPRRGGGPLNIQRTWARNPALFQAQRGIQSHVLRALPPRETELAILRIGWRCHSEYAFAQHVVAGREAGITGDEIERIMAGPDAPGWSPFEAALLRGVDELHDDAFITDATWAVLKERYSDEQMIDYISVVGRYATVAMFVNSCGVQLEPNREGFPAGH